MVGACGGCRRRSRRLKLWLLTGGFLFWRLKIRRRRRQLARHPEPRQKKDSPDEHRLPASELNQKTAEKFRTHFRMPPETFYKLLEYVRDSIEKVTTNMKTPISAEDRLGVTLRFLVDGETYTALAVKCKMSKTIVSRIIPETCRAIWTALKPVVLPDPTKDKWKEVSEQFEMKYRFPNCLGAIGGKHIEVRPPTDSESLFYSYKKDFSIVLMAAVDANCRFVIVDLGKYGKSADGQILAESHFATELLNGRLDLPDDKALPGQSELVPHVFVGDEAFPLKRNLLQPFTGSSLHDQEKIVFNYRLSRVRLTIETAFRLMVSRFKVLSDRIQISPDRADSIIKACTVLHNFLTEDSLANDDCAPKESASTADVEELQSIHEPSSDDASKVREAYLRHFNSKEGCFDWQREHDNQTEND